MKRVCYRWKLFPCSAGEWNAPVTLWELGDDSPASLSQSRTLLKESSRWSKSTDLQGLVKSSDTWLTSGHAVLGGGGAGPIAKLPWNFYSGAVGSLPQPGAILTRVYDLTERVIPHEILTVQTPSLEDAQRQLIRIAGRALGLATESDLRDYFRLRVDEARTRIAELVETGDLVPVIVEDWKAYLHRDAKIPRRIDAQALISPFDPLIWERKRPERLFRFRYRIEIYTPAHKREHGYYVLPFLLGDQLVARVDLKADRKLGRLHVLSAHEEPGVDRPLVAEALAGELALLAEWLGLDGIWVADRGALAASVRLAVNSG